jgi:hypothetical protein
MLMGLDMYLTGDKYTRTFGDNNPALVDGYEVESQRLKLGYWRKHWALHNYIEQKYVTSGGKILLEADFLLEIADAVEQGNLPEANYLPTIDASYKEPEEIAKTVKIFRDAADWLDGGEWRSVEYVGSW